MGWLFALGILILLGFMPLGICGVYDAGGPTAKLLVGPVRISLYPRQKKDKKVKVKKNKPKQEVATHNTGNPEKKGGNYSEFLPYLNILLDFLGELRKKMRVKRMEMLLCMAGGDPCELGINYGRAWAAVGTLMPQLEQLFVIERRDVQVLCDFTQVQTTLYFRVEIAISLGGFLGLLMRYGWRALKEYRKVNNNKKGGALK